MFSYYGSKSKIVKLYPTPKYPLIIEPFAGSARYSLLYSDREVWLNDKYDVIAGIWKYLISATEEQISALPNLKQGDDLRDLEGLSDVERNLMGFMVNSGVASPRNVCTKWAHDKNEIEKTKTRILNNLTGIRHWRVTCLPYQEIENQEATWFIDPPYVNPGIRDRYVEDEIDYQELSEWCKSRKGQVIVCENGNADWLPFSPLRKIYGQRKTTVETVWIKD